MIKFSFRYMLGLQVINLQNLSAQNNGIGINVRLMLPNASGIYNNYGSVPFHFHFQDKCCTPPIKSAWEVTSHVSLVEHSNGN